SRRCTSAGRGGDHRPGRLPGGQDRGPEGSCRVLLAVVAETGCRRGPPAHVLCRVRSGRSPPALCGTHQPPSGPLHLLRHGPLAGRTGAQAGVPRPGGGHRGRTVRDEFGVGPCRPGRTGSPSLRTPSGRYVLPPVPLARAAVVPGAVGE